MLNASVNECMLRNMLLTKYGFNLRVLLLKIKACGFDFLLFEFICFPFESFSSPFVFGNKPLDFMIFPLHFSLFAHGLPSKTKEFAK